MKKRVFTTIGLFSTLLMVGGTAYAATPDAGLSNTVTQSSGSASSVPIKNLTIDKSFSTAPNYTYNGDSQGVADEKNQEAWQQIFGTENANNIKNSKIHLDIADNTKQSTFEVKGHIQIGNDNFQLNATPETYTTVKTSLGTLYRATLDGTFQGKSNATNVTIFINYIPSNSKYQVSLTFNGVGYPVHLIYGDLFLTPNISKEIQTSINTNASTQVQQTSGTVKQASITPSTTNNGEFHVINTQASYTLDGNSVSFPTVVVRSSDVVKGTEIEVQDEVWGTQGAEDYINDPSTGRYSWVTAVHFHVNSPNSQYRVVTNEFDPPLQNYSFTLAPISWLADYIPTYGNLISQLANYNIPISGTVFEGNTTDSYNAQVKMYGISQSKNYVVSTTNPGNSNSYQEGFFVKGTYGQSVAVDGLVEYEEDNYSGFSTVDQSGWDYVTGTLNAPIY